LNFSSTLWRAAILGICSTLAISVATGFVFLIKDALWENLKGKHDIQGHALTQEKATTINGFDVREGTFTAEVRGQSVVYHNVYLLTDFQAIVRSVSPDDP
jgi:hypothetical protein